MPRDLFRRRQCFRILAWHCKGPHAGARRSRAEHIGRDLGRGQLSRIGIDQRLKCGLGGRIGSPIGEGLEGSTGSYEDRPAVIGAPEQRIERTDEPPIGGHIDRHDFIPGLGLDMAERRQLAEHAGIADQDVEPAPAFMDGRSQSVEGRVIRDIRRHQSGGATHRLDFIVELLEPPLGAGKGDDMRTFRGQCQGDIFANAARRTGDDRDAVLKLLGHEDQPASARSESCCLADSPTMSVRWVG